MVPVTPIITGITLHVNEISSPITGALHIV